MATISKTYRVGNASVTRVLERALTFPAPWLLPDWDPATAAAEQDWLVPDSMDEARENLTLNVHTWLVRTPQHTVLVDTGIGNGKARASALFNNLDTPYLARLAAAGVAPEAVTHVLMTHVHTDHVGWNTRLAGDGRRWIPAFPNARYMVPSAGRDYFSGPEGRSRPNFDMYADSIRPVIEAGQAEMVGMDGGEVLDGFVYHPTPGHSVDHMSIAFSSDGAEALFAGDVMHHPIQVCRPDWNSTFCAAPEQAVASRRWALEYASRRHALYFSSHFPATSAGRLIQAAESFHWQFA
jgi:glyoxylase-like metal-dependent hydrolase (beta-lactamase superfamily II)